MNDLESLLKDGSRTQITAALKVGASPNILFDYGYTALMYVCEERFDVVIARRLVEHGAEVNARDQFGNTVLSRFVTTDYVRQYMDESSKGKMYPDIDEAMLDSTFAIIHVLLEYGADVNAPNNYGGTPLMYCAGRYRNPHIAGELIKAGADPDRRDNYGYTALTLAASRQRYFTEPGGNLLMVKRLVDSTSKAIPVPADGTTPMVAAINSANIEAIYVLVDAGYNIETTPPFAHLEPIIAVITGDTERLAESLSQGFSVEAKTTRGRTPLMWAAQLGRLNMVRFLLDAGADIEAMGEFYGTFGTALFAAVEGNRLDVCKLLLERGAKPIIQKETPERADRLRPSHNSSPFSAFFFDLVDGMYIDKENVLQWAITLNNNSPTKKYRELCLFLWKAVADKSGVDTTMLTGAELAGF